MLDSNTKRRIDSCRDILVGKVPDPKSQVEQITVALIYKFMDDMDAEAEELGGKRSFFAGEYGKYGWAKLMAPNQGGFDVLALYSEAIGKMNENPGIPPLFRDIFKNAYLPYRDPETLRAFLKEIDGFTYDHSERLGDAFEYLLSVLGSQGDAGQFRTPRHIIDFMVEVIDPKKNESVLDPACGTAGFLISAWKHILKQNTKERPGDQLTPEERATLVANIHGYDISPDMVRLSLVNLYLHGFTDPHIVEYDTLTSEERWNETADIILANPPFMSPKGGIKPHKRFSVQATRSEVLFVDYMAEHLSPQGRAAIVVPEGIIFQSGTAYKKLREMLVKNSLVAVVSLPAGVFNPYSGVKTSILILDKRLSKACDSVLFVKVGNDGYGLGAQRRAVTGNDLPAAGRLLRAFFADAAAVENSPMAHKVAKVKIGENGEWNLSGDRYRESVSISATWPMVKLGELTRRVSGGTPSKSNEDFWTGSIPWVSPKDMKVGLLHDTEDHVSEAAIKSSSTSLVPAGTLLCVVRSGILKHSLPLAITAREMCFNQDIIALIPTDQRLDVCYLYSLLKARSREILEIGIKPGVTVESFHAGFFSQLEIPLPPRHIQQEIVAEIESYQKIIDGARQVLESYRPHIFIHPDWPVFELSGVTTKITDGAHFTPTYVETGVPFLRVTDITESNTSKKFIPQEEHDELIKRCRPEKGDVLYSKNGTIGIAKLVNWDWEFSIFVSLCLIKPKSELLDSHYLECFLNSDGAYTQATARSKSGTVTNLHLVDIKTIKIPVPPIEVQRIIVAEIEAEQALVNANKQLIKRFEAKIMATINRVWGSSE